MKPSLTAIDLVGLARRYKLLGGFSDLSIDASDAPDVGACIAALAESEPKGWRAPGDPGNGTSVPIYNLRVEGVRIDVWNIPRPASFTGSDAGWYEAEERAGALLLEMAGMGPKRRAGRKVA